MWNKPIITELKFTDSELAHDLRKAGPFHI